MGTRAKASVRVINLHQRVSSNSNMSEEEKLEEDEEEEDTFTLTDDQVADFKDAFKKFDAAGAGEIPTSELGTVELMRTKTKEAQDEVEVKEAFRILDKDGKGEIHTDVIKEILMKLDDNLTDADLNEMIAEIDEDGSGWVDYDEFKGLMLG